ncbi:GIY-YIG nuclease family protein [Hyphomonas sp. NPDC076900]|uniref:GIY-YIG nuclease family protein n=1 Tax=unclassified Hyphomonas TaxID=2630699 RepID=UPI003CFFDC93
MGGHEGAGLASGTCYRRAMQFWVYILECSDGRFYVGSHRGDDPENRVHEHNQGLYPKAYTFRRRPVKLVWSGEFEDPNDAVCFERQLKGWSRAKKIAFINGDWDELKELAKSRTAPAIHEKGLFYKLTHPDADNE